jgi:hypothetical protein
MRFRIQRSHFRIPYPMQGRPRLLLQGPEGMEHEVIDLSERGIRFAAARSELPPVGTRMTGLVRFQRGVEVDVEGDVIRIQEGQVAIHLTRREIPLGVIYDEQRFLRARFPVWADERFRQGAAAA